MLEKIAEMVREGWSEDEFDYVPCQACIYAPLGGDACDLHRHGRVFPDKEAAIEPGIAVYMRECPNPSAPDGSLMLARWAVLLVARGLEKELGAVEVADEGRAVARFFSRSDDDRIIDASDALDEAFLKLGEALYRLTHEAKEGPCAKE